MLAGLLIACSRSFGSTGISLQYLVTPSLVRGLVNAVYLVQLPGTRQAEKTARKIGGKLRGFLFGNSGRLGFGGGLLDGFLDFPAYLRVRFNRQTLSQRLQ